MTFTPGILLALAAVVGADAKAEADPAATKLLTEARAARASWENFPGFTADLEVNVEGKVAKGRVTVTAKGEVTVEMPDPDEARGGWALHTLSSTVGHRLGGDAGPETPCAFADDVTDHPLGRAVRVLEGEFHSSYRIRDKQILVVNRQMKDSRFTITVLENAVNEEKKFLPACFVVNTWDAKTDALTNSETHHQTWKRVDKFDLPVELTVVTATPGKQEVRSLKLSNHRLTPAGK
jgi:hypothetical protein